MHKLQVLPVLAGRNTLTGDAVPSQPQRQRKRRASLPPPPVWLSPPTLQVVAAPPSQLTAQVTCRNCLLPSCPGAHAEPPRSPSTSTLRTSAPRRTSLPHHHHAEPGRHRHHDSDHHPSGGHLTRPSFLIHLLSSPDIITSSCRFLGGPSASPRSSGSRYKSAKTTFYSEPLKVLTPVDSPPPLYSNQTSP